MHGGTVIKSLTCEWPVYPGHPLVLATAIMQAFPTFAEANRPTEHGWCEALADSRIPGAGDHVGADRRILLARHELYQQARDRNPRRWSRDTRNWKPIDVVTLNPERDPVARAGCRPENDKQRMAA